MSEPLSDAVLGASFMFVTILVALYVVDVVLRRRREKLDK